MNHFIVGVWKQAAWEAMHKYRLELGNHLQVLSGIWVSEARRT